MHRYISFLALLFTGTASGSMIVPYMGFFLVEGLGQEPWVISVYAGAVALLVVTFNRIFSRQMDAGRPAFPLIGYAACGSLVAAGALALMPVLPVVFTVAILGFGIGASAMSTMFSLGVHLARQSGVEPAKFNAYMRATTSLAWMIGPTISFLVADRLGPAVVFDLVFFTALAWVFLWWRVAPREAFAARRVDPARGAASSSGALWIAGVFVGCLAAAHFITFTALPLFFVREVGLPGYAPGNAFTIKTALEIAAIATTPFLIARFGLRRALIGTAALAVIAIFYLASVQTYAQMLVGAALEGVYYGLFSTLAIGWVQALVPDRPAQATAVYWNATMITSVVSGPAAGLIAQGADFRTAILVSAAVAMVAFAIIALSGRHPTIKAAEAQA